MFIDEPKDKLTHLMKEFHTGEAKAAKKKVLLVELFGKEAVEDESNNNPFDRDFRALVEEIIQDGGLICSSPSRGYWWAASLKDGLTAAEGNKKRALTQLKNAEKLEENLKKQFGGQLPLM